METLVTFDTDEVKREGHVFMVIELRKQLQSLCQILEKYTSTLRKENMSEKEEILRERDGKGVAEKKENLQDTKQVDGFRAIILPYV
jgi:hypothetical protein